MKTEKIAEMLRLMLVISQAEARPRSVAELAELAFAGGAASLQLREKSMPDRDFYDEACAIGQLCRQHGKAFIIDDRLDIALATDADALHLGQKDLPAATARRLWPRPKILGISVNTAEQAQTALDAGADYLGVGAVFPTGSKNDAIAVTPETVSAIVALGAPTIAIGGISVANAHLVWKTGVSGLAVISALAGADNPKGAAARLMASR